MKRTYIPVLFVLIAVLSVALRGPGGSLLMAKEEGKSDGKGDGKTDGKGDGKSDGKGDGKGEGGKGEEGKGEGKGEGEGKSEEKTHTSEKKTTAAQTTSASQQSVATLVAAGVQAEIEGDKGKALGYYRDALRRLKSDNVDDASQADLINFLQQKIASLGG